MRITFIILLAACSPAPRCPVADLAPLPAPPRYAVVASDYASSAIALLDDEGALVTEAWMDSGTFAPRVVAALSGDVVLPTAPLDGCTLGVVDRFTTDVVTLLDVCSHDREGVIEHAIDARAGTRDEDAAFSPNPQDILLIGGSHWISRLNPHPEGAAGNDLIRVDAGGAVVERVDLGALDVVTGERFYARPSRMVAIDRFLVVGLARLTASFMRAAAGAVAIVDTQSATSTALPLEGLANCTEVVPAGAERVLVACPGDPFVRGEARRARAGLALVAIRGGAPSVDALWRAADHPDAPIAASTPVWVGGRALAVAMGDRTTGEDDRAVLVDLASGEHVVLVEAGDAFVLGSGAYDSDSQLLLLPDAERSEVRRFAGAELRELEPVAVASCRGLPPREIRRVR